jgi:hypothetical protein
MGANSEVKISEPFSVHDCNEATRPPATPSDEMRDEEVLLAVEHGVGNIDGKSETIWGSAGHRLLASKRSEHVATYEADQRLLFPTYGRQANDVGQLGICRRLRQIGSSGSLDTVGAAFANGHRSESPTAFDADG